MSTENTARIEPSDEILERFADRLPSPSIAGLFMMSLIPNAKEMGDDQLGDIASGIAVGYLLGRLDAKCQNTGLPIELVMLGVLTGEGDSMKELLGL